METNPFANPEEHFKATTHKRQQIAPLLSNPEPPKNEKKSLLVIRFATTLGVQTYDWPFEIIQISAAIIFQSTDESQSSVYFDEYVCPSLNRKLSESCVFRTGISQKSIDRADSFPVVFQRFTKWIRESGLEDKFIVVTLDSREMWLTAQYQFILNRRDLPVYFKRFVCIQKTFSRGDVRTKLDDYIKSPNCNELNSSKFVDQRKRKYVQLSTELDELCDAAGITINRTDNKGFDYTVHLGKVVRRLLDAGVTINVNCVMECYKNTRNQKLILNPLWRQNEQLSNQLHERVLPLVPYYPAINNADIDFKMCSSCNTLLEECGTKGFHKQFPVEWYRNQNLTFGPIVFSESAHLNLDRSACPFDHLLCIDLKTTSQDGNYDYPSEIIKMSVVVVDVRSNRIKTNVKFNTFVKPIVNTKLTDSCIQATGVNQVVVDTAETFLKVYAKFNKWLERNGFRPGNFAIVSENEHNIWRFLQYQMKLSGFTMPSHFRSYVNLWRLFQVESAKAGWSIEVTRGNPLELMISSCGLNRFEPPYGQLTNEMMLAKIMQKMISINCGIYKNEALVCYSTKRKTEFQLDKETWRQKFDQAMQVYNAILHLTVRPIAQKSTYVEGYCITCERKIERCGDMPSRIPQWIYHQPSEIVFARTARYY